MMVKYVRDRGYKGAGMDPNLTLGKVYLVFGIVFRADFSNYPHQVIVESDADLTPSLWELQYFDLVDERVPEKWVFNAFKYFGVVDGYYQLCPVEFSGDFWDLFHDADAAAEKKFLSVKDSMEKFHVDGGSDLH